MADTVVEFAIGKWMCLKDKWSKASLFSKFVILMVAYPWLPTIGYAIYKLNPPDEVKILAKENGDIIVEAVGTAWQLAAYLFMNALGL